MPRLTSWRGVALALGLVVVTLSACDSGTSNEADTSTPVVSPGPSLAGHPLPTSPPFGACAGIETSGRIILASTMAGVVGRLDSGVGLAIFWPPGFWAVFDPDFREVLDANGAVFATAGEDIHPRLSTGRWGDFTACLTSDGIYIFRSTGPVPNG